MEEQIRKTIATFICDELYVDIEDVHPEKNFSVYGLGSTTAAMLTSILEDAYDLTLSPVLIFDHPTIDALTSTLCDQVKVVKQ